MLRQLATQAFVSVIALSVTTAVQARCWQTHEIEAAEVRYFQSMLMVGALRCRDGNRFIEDDYNRFVTRSRNALDDHNEIIYARFERDYGRDSDLYYDRFTTRLANDYSAQTDWRGFCDEAASLARISAESHPHDVVVLAKSVVDDLPLIDPRCEARRYQGYASAPPSLQFRAEETRSGVNYHVGAAPPAQQPVTVSTAAPPATVSTASATPVEVATAPPPGVAPADVAEQDAMGAAILALEEAAAALRAAQADAGSGAAGVDVGLVIVDGVPTDNRPIVGVR